MGKLKEVFAESIIGPCGNTVEVGDTVMTVTSGYSHRVHTNKGVYKGFIIGSDGMKYARVEVTEEQRTWVNSDGEPYSYLKHNKINLLNSDFKVVVTNHIRKSTLRLNRLVSIK